jgi:hypothetical protein
LWTLLNGTWVASDYSYTAATLPAAIISPASPSTLSAASATFVWSAGGGTQYSFSISPSCAGPNYYSYQGPDTSVIANNLPTNGSTLCVILSTLINGTWVAADRYWSYTAANLPGTITSPANGSTLNGASATFQWTAGGGKQFSLFVGTSFGASDIYSANQGTNLSVTVNSLPTNGSTLYVRLWTLIGGTWQAMDYTYTAFNSLSGKSSESAVQARRLQWR